jgi:mannose-6-phosphate isomerase-like protein (cupin superfamily)
MNWRGGWLQIRMNMRMRTEHWIVLDGRTDSRENRTGRRDMDVFLQPDQHMFELIEVKSGINI